ncbi:MAG: TetR/AcrR family transcriptional regulator [Acidobacteriaceae bacterium]
MQKKIRSCIFPFRLARRRSGFINVTNGREETLVKASVHKQERAVATRRELINAARVVFATTGFESARIEQIAAEAGKTRGAFYANFKDKEDVFFALFEEDLMRDQEKIVADVSAAATLDEKIDILSGHLDELLHDRQRLLLNLEFKMYVIRHPQKRRRLNEIYMEMCMRCAMAKINSFMPDSGPDERRRLTTEMGAMIDGLALNTMFNPEGLSAGQRTRLLKLSARDALRDVGASLAES